MTKTYSEFDPRLVKVNFTLGTEEIALILSGLRTQPKDQAQGLFEMMRNAVLTEIDAAREAHKALNKE